jgi:hypothetical protein
MDSVIILQDSLKNTSQVINNAQFSTETLSLVIALLAILFAPIIQLIISKRQINSSVLSKNRQEWINTLRDSISEFISAITMIDDKKISTNEQFDSHTTKLERILYINTKINLLINPNEEDHILLAEKLKRLLELYVKPDNNEKIKVIDDTVELSQKILKREWERVKKLK